MSDIMMDNETTKAKKTGQVFAFWSPQTGCGSSFVLYNFAKSLALSGKKVLILDYNLREPNLTKDLATNDTLHYLDNLLPSAEVGNISSEVFNSYIQDVKEIPNLHFIAGNNSVEQALDIQVPGLENIINKAKNDYDYVLIDTNAYIDNAGTYIALYLADKIYTIVEKKIGVFRSYDYCKSLVEPMKDKMVFVINKADKAIYLSTSEVEKYFEIDKSYELINLGFEYLNAENTGRGEQFINDSKKGRIFKEDINSLIKNTINVDTSNGKKKGLFGK